MYACFKQRLQGLKTRSMIKFDKFQVCPTPPHPPTITTEKLSWQSFHQSWWRIWGTQNTQFCSQNTCSSKFSSFIQSFLCIFCSYRVQFYKTLWLQFLFSFPFLPIFNFSSIKNQSNVPFFFFFFFFLKHWSFTPSWITALSWWRGLCNSVKLWATPCRATQDSWVTVKVLTKHDLLGEEMANHSSMLAVRTPEQYEKAKRYDTGRWIPPIWRYLICYWGRTEGNY